MSESPDPDELTSSRNDALFAKAAAVFFRIDPARINFETNSDEYEPEVRTVLPRLKSAGSVSDVRRILDEEFRYWFNGANFDAKRADELAVELWALWQESQHEAG